MSVFVKSLLKNKFFFKFFFNFFLLKFLSIAVIAIANEFEIKRIRESLHSFISAKLQEMSSTV